MRRLIWGGLVVAVLSPGRALAQAVPAPEPRLEHRDVSVLIGWSEARHPDHADSYNSWFRMWAAAATAGHYWTDHHKTEVSFARTRVNERDVFGDFTSVPGPPAVSTYRVEQHRLQTTTLSVVQSYQFFRNASFHPFVGAGVAIDFDRWRTRTETNTTVHRAIGSVLPDETTTVVQESGPVTEVVPRGVAMAGFKAYPSQRVFVRSDITVSLLPAFDRVVWRFGVGFDF